MFQRDASPARRLVIWFGSPRRELTNGRKGSDTVNTRPKLSQCLNLGTSRELVQWTWYSTYQTNILALLCTNMAHPLPGDTITRAGATCGTAVQCSTCCGERVAPTMPSIRLSVRYRCEGARNSTQRCQQLNNQLQHQDISSLLHYTLQCKSCMC